MFKFATLLGSILLLLAGASSAVAAEPDFSPMHPSTQRTYMVAIRPLVTPVPIDKIHNWEIRVTTPAGAPVAKAKFGFGGGMPEHGHGFPTEPEVTEELGDGRYLLEGVKFSMSGWWQMKLNIESDLGRDEAVFNTMVTLPSPELPGRRQ